VDCYQSKANRHIVLVCNNYIDKVSTHEIETGKKFRVRKSRILLRKQLRIPDGISVSRNHQWLAVSSHATGTVHVYKNGARLNRRSISEGLLSAVVCPHGLRFTPDGRFLCVADAASPYLHIYESERGEWEMARGPTKSIKVLDEKTFQLGRYNALEGGVKGLDINNSGSVLLTTCEHQVLAFYDLKALLAQPGSRTPDEEIDELTRKRNELFVTPRHRGFARWRRLMRRVFAGTLLRTK
jgi:WD40 repeat protein